MIRRSSKETLKYLPLFVLKILQTAELENQLAQVLERKFLAYW
jgi:hypothetical protein